jgi:hypothetical protein
MFQRLFVSFEMHFTRSLDSKLFAPADAGVDDRISGGPSAITSRRAGP